MRRYAFMPNNSTSVLGDVRITEDKPDGQQPDNITECDKTFKGLYFDIGPYTVIVKPECPAPDGYGRLSKLVQMF